MSESSGVDAGALAESLRRLGHEGHEVDLVASLRRVVEACVEVFGVTGCGLMLADEQTVQRYVVATDAASRVLENVQVREGQGPCVDTFVHGGLVEVEDLAADDRWPAVRDEVLPHGVRALLGIPVHLHGPTVGSINVYLDRPHRWDDSERRALLRYGDVIETTLANALAAHSAGDLARQLQYALDYRVVIERAVGYLMAGQGLRDVAAFDRLRRAARTTRRRIGDVAEDLLATGHLPGGPGTPGTAPPSPPGGPHHPPAAHRPDAPGGPTHRSEGTRR